MHQRHLLPQGQIPPFNPVVLPRRLRLLCILPGAVETTPVGIAFNDDDHLGVDAREVAAAVRRPAILRTAQRVQERQPHFPLAS